MSMDYLRISLSGMLTSGSYPEAPNVLYVPYGPDLDLRIVGTVEFLGLDFYFDFYDFPVGRPFVFYYRSYKALPAHFDYAELNESFSTSFATAINSGNLSGTYVGRKGATWNITHYQDVSDDLDLPSGEGGEPATIFTYSTPLAQGYDLPDKASTPSPADTVTDVRLNLAKLNWV